MSNLFKLVNVEQDVARPGDLLVEVGEQAFTTTLTTVEVTTSLTEVLYAFLTVSGSVSPDAQDVEIQTDKTVTSGAVTVVRPASGASGLEFSWMFIGRKVA